VHVKSVRGRKKGGGGTQGYGVTGAKREVKKGGGGRTLIEKEDGNLN